jgi:hypothetical protein
MRQTSRPSLRFVDTFWVTCSLLISFNVSSFALTNLLVNGSFESPLSPSWLAHSSTTGGGTGIAADGLWHAFIGVSIEQAVPTVAGEDYVVTFAGKSPMPVVMWDGVAVTNVTIYSLYNAVWSYAFIHVHATSNLSTLKFLNGQLDDVKLVWAREPIPITAQPENKSAFEGGAVSFAVQAPGPQGLFYQWFFQGQPINGARSSTFAASPLQLSHAGQYHVVVSNLWNSTTSTPAQLQVTPPPSAPEFIVQPYGDVSPVGYASSLNAFAVGAAPLTYQWSKDGLPLAGATSASLGFAAMQTSDAGTYQLLVSNQFGTVLSLPAVLTVTNITGGGAASFNHYSNSAAIRDVDGTTRLAGTAYRAQLYAGATPGILRPVGTSMTFQNGTFAGYPGGSAGFTRQIPDVPPGQTAYLQIRAWESAAGSSYEQARASGGKYGFSAIYEKITSNGQRVVATPFNLRAGEPFFRAGVLSAGLPTPEGAAQFTLSGQAGARYLIETKQPPNNWVPFRILTNLAGQAVFTDTNLSGTMQFYRARLLD